MLRIAVIGLLVLAPHARAQAPSAPLPWRLPAVRDEHLRYGQFRSAAAQGDVSFHVYEPPAYARTPDERFPVLYWLHGTEGGTAGVRPVAQLFHRAIAERRAPAMLVVFVNGLPRRLWMDSKDAASPVETVFVKELIPHIDRRWRTIASREGRLLEGFSMGGFGAARIGLKHADLFTGVSVLAGGPLDLAFQGPRARGNPLREQILRTVCGGELSYFQAHHPLTVAARRARDVIARGQVIRVAVGERDNTAHLNRAYSARLRELKIPHSLVVVPGIAHDARGLLQALFADRTRFYRIAIAAGAAGSK